jgi:5-methylcytosine-specific restriction endonuclease McrA
LNHGGRLQIRDLRTPQIGPSELGPLGIRVRCMDKDRGQSNCEAMERLGQTWMGPNKNLAAESESGQAHKRGRHADHSKGREIRLGILIMRTRTIQLVPVRPNVTDRALRYRANQTPPEGPRICCYCGSRRFVEIDHVNGHEEDSAPANLAWSCRSCNTTKGVVLRNAGLGRRTVQYNPGASGARSLGQWLTAVMAAKGQSDAMSVRDAVEMIRATPQSRRSEFAQEIWSRRRERGTDSSVPF